MNNFIRKCRIPLTYAGPFVVRSNVTAVTTAVKPAEEVLAPTVFTVARFKTFVHILEQKKINFHHKISDFSSADWSRAMADKSTDHENDVTVAQFYIFY